MRGLGRTPRGAGRLAGVDVAPAGDAGACLVARAGDGGAVAGPVPGRAGSGEGGSEIRVVVPCRTINPLNQREHWQQRARRVRDERTHAAVALHGTERPALPCVVTFTRVAPSSGLDCDSLPASCKGMRDQVAHWLGVDDRDPRVRWVYLQRRGPWAVEIEMRSEA